MKLKIILLSVLLSSFLSRAQSEFINDDFGTNGLMCVDIPGETIKMGDMIKVGSDYYGLANFRNHHLVKFSPDGQLDTSFGTNGYKPIDISNLEGGLGMNESHIIKTPDNNFLIVTIFQGEFGSPFMTKTDFAGNTVTSFGASGSIFSWGSDRIIFYSAEIINNEIVLTGSGNSTDPENPYRYLAVMKFDMNGSPITSFSNNGSLTAYFDADIFPVDAHYYDDSGKMVMVGAYLSADDMYSTLAKYDMASGLPDTTFGTDGQVIFNSQNTQTYSAFRTLNCIGDAIYVGGFKTGSDGHVFFKKFTAAGQPDTSFGTAGTFTRAMPGMWSYTPAYVTEDNGDFLMTGQLTYENEDYEKIFFLKMTGAGMAANSFGNNGIIVNPMNLAHYGGGFRTLIDGETITVATLSTSCSSDDQPKPAVMQFRANELSTDKFEEGNVAYYPNPVKNNLTILSENQVDRLEIFDVSGKLVNVISNPASNSADLSQLQSGLYLVKVFCNGSIGNIKVIKE